MKITHIHASNFLGARAVDVPLAKRINLFAGANGAGKSSLRDAIALALTADLGRVSLKKEAGQLVTDGADVAAIALTVDGRELFVSITAAGKVTDKAGGLESPALRFALDGQRFARLEPKERRAFLFDLMGLSAGSDAVRERLLAKGCDKARVERVIPLLRAGFDAASKEAKEKATQAKGAWRALTGEAFGSEKVKTWRAAAPAYDAARGKELTTQLQHCDAALEQWQQQVGKLQAEQARRAQLQAKLPALDEHAGRLERIETKLEADKKGLADAEKAVHETAVAAGKAPRTGLLHELAWAVDNLLLHGDSLGDDPQDRRILAALAAYEREHGKVQRSEPEHDQEAAARLPGLRNSRDLMDRSVANGQRDQAAALQARDEAEAIRAELAETFDVASLDEARTKVADLKAKREQLVKQADALKALKLLAEGAERKTEEASKHAADVAAWDAIGDALSPNGVPAEMLGEALDPINDRLAKSALDAEWPRVGVDADMTINVGDSARAYGLLSESEKWRCDAMLAEAIAHLSGTKLLVLDRFDVLDVQGRGDLIAWLDILASDGEIDSALIFGTLKAAPSGLPETIAAHWIENGVLGLLREAA